jgi:hypothetical protein
MRYIFLLVAVWGVSGCATSRQVVPFPVQNIRVESPDKGRIYIIGHPAVMNLTSHNVRVTVVADTKWIGDIVGHTYLCWEREPGVAEISGRRIKTNDIHLTVERGKVYYVILHIYPAIENVFQLHPGGGSIHAEFERVGEEQGKEALADSKPAEQK